MTATRRVGSEKSRTRARLLDVTEEVMLHDGYAAVSSRSVATRAGVQAGLVHYYFPTLDDLFVAALRRRSEQGLERLVAALDAHDPVAVLWEHANDKTTRALTLEFLALANHRKAVRAALAEVASEFRKVELEALAKVLAAAGVDPDEYPADALLFIMQAIPTTIVLEEGLGMSLGHANALRLVERYLEQIGIAAPRPAAVKRASSRPRRKAPARRT